MRELRESLDALPERLVNAIREALPQQPAQPAQSQSQQAAETKKEPETKKEAPTVPGKKTFAEWWFGK